MKRRRHLLAAAASVALATAASAHASQAVAVSLKAGASTAALGQPVVLTAAAHGLGHGDKVRIVGTRGGGHGVFTVATCAKALCTRRYSDSLGETVVFRAIVLSHGKTVARSASVSVAWQDTSPPAPSPAPTPPPPPAPSAPPGHYCGLTNEGKSICFDVTSPQVAVTNLHTESIANCGDGSSWMWTLSFSAPVSILQPGLTMSYQFNGSLPDSGGATHIQISYSVNATFDTAGNASGTIVLSHISWDDGGTHYDCAGDPRTWTARLGA